MKTVVKKILLHTAKCTSQLGPKSYDTNLTYLWTLYVFLRSEVSFLKLAIRQNNETI